MVVAFMQLQASSLKKKYGGMLVLWEELNWWCGEFLYCVFSVVESRYSF
jgi:hypothetical protein